MARCKSLSYIFGKTTINEKQLPKTQPEGEWSQVFMIRYYYIYELSHIIWLGLTANLAAFVSHLQLYQHIVLIYYSLCVSNEWCIHDVCSFLCTADFVTFWQKSGNMLLFPDWEETEYATSEQLWDRLRRNQSSCTLHIAPQPNTGGNPLHNRCERGSHICNGKSLTQRFGI